MRSPSLRPSSWLPLLAVAYLLVPSLLWAQQAVPSGRDLTVEWTASVTPGVTAYRLYVDGKPITPDLPATATRATVPGQSAGPHRVGVTAISRFGESEPAEIVFEAGDRPMPPRELKLSPLESAVLRVEPDGTVVLDLQFGAIPPVAEAARGR